MIQNCQASKTIIRFKQIFMKSIQFCLTAIHTNLYISNAIITKYRWNHQRCSVGWQRPGVKLTYCALHSWKSQTSKKRSSPVLWDIECHVFQLFCHTTPLLSLPITGIFGTQGHLSLPLYYAIGNHVPWGSLFTLNFHILFLVSQYFIP